MSLFSTLRRLPTQRHSLMWALRVAFLLMGFTFSITQVVMIRAFLVAFSGNELSIGLVLGGWLILEAAGSGMLGRLADRLSKTPVRGLPGAGGMRGGPGTFALLQVLLALTLPLSLYAAFTVRQLVGAVPGMGIGLGTMAVASFLILAPLGLVDGAMFTFGCRALARLPPISGGLPPISGGLPPEMGGRPDEAGSTGGLVYSLEAVGGIAGGLIFTYLFISHLDPLQTVLVLTVLNLASAVSLVALADGSALRRRACWPLLALLAGAVYLLLFQGTSLQGRLNRQQWPGYDLAFYDDSIYGNVTVIRQGSQYTFFTDGTPALTIPVPDVVLAEELVHLPMLFVAEPRRVLVIGGGAGGVLHEILKYPVEQVDYAELDPLLIQAVRRFPTQLTEKELKDPRVQVHHVDGRLLIREKLKETDSRYDLILVNLSYPSTLELNRLYTREFFAMVRALLSPDGVLATCLPGSTEYLSPAQRDLHATLQRTLLAVFPAARPIPGETTLWLASLSPAVLSLPLDTLLSRWQERDISTILNAEFHFRFKLDPQRLIWFQDELNRAPAPRVNEDLRPAGLLYGLAYWNEIFAPHLAGYFRLLQNVRLSWLLLPLIALTPLVWLLLRPTPRRRALTIPLAILSTGFAGMAFSLLVIFAFQSFYGYVYYLIGLLTTAFMAGLALGGWRMTRRVRDEPVAEGRLPAGRRLLLGLESILVGYWSLFPAVLWLLYAYHDRPLTATLLGPLLLLLNALAGLLTGLEFPLANRLLLAQGHEVSATAGMLYAADLVGACSSALVVSLVLLPTLGVIQTCLLVLGVKGVSLLLLAVLKISS